MALCGHVGGKPGRELMRAVIAELKMRPSMFGRLSDAPSCNSLHWACGRRALNAVSYLRRAANQGILDVDLPRPYTFQERREVLDDMEAALAQMPKIAGDVALTSDDRQTYAKLELLGDQRGAAGLEDTARLLAKALRWHGTLSNDMRKCIIRGDSVPGFLNDVFEHRDKLSPTALCQGACVAAALVGPGTTEPSALLEELLLSLAPMVPCVPLAETSALLDVCSRCVPPPPAMTHFLEVLISQVTESLPSKFYEHGIVAALSALGGSVGPEVDPVVLSDFLVALQDVWPLCKAQTLISALLSTGQAGIMDVGLFRVLVEQLEARIQLLGSSDRESLVLLLGLHKSAFDRIAANPHPLYSDSCRRLMRTLAADYPDRCANLPLQDLARPTLALAQLGALDRRGRLILEERLSSGRLLTLPPAAFVSLIYAHRLIAGREPRQQLRTPLLLGFGGQLHQMEPRQVLTCVESLWRYRSKGHSKVFEDAYEVLARTVEEGNTHAISPSEIVSAISTYPQIRLKGSQPLLRILHTLVPGMGIPRAGDAPVMRSPATGVLPVLAMEELVTILEAFSAQGLGGCSNVCSAIVDRYRDSGGRISRRNTARALHSLARLGERPPQLLSFLLTEVEGWVEQDPDAVDARTRPILTTLWAVCALDAVARIPVAVDWMLAFLCNADVIVGLVERNREAHALFESLSVVKAVLPEVAGKYLQLLDSTDSLVAGSVFKEVGIGLPCAEPAYLHTGGGPATHEHPAALGPGVRDGVPDGDDVIPRTFSANRLVDITHEVLSGDGAFHRASCSSVEASKDITDEMPDCYEDLPALPGTQRSVLKKALGICRVSHDHVSSFSSSLAGTARGQSVLNDLGVRWGLGRRRSAPVSKAKLVLGDVFAALNVGAALRSAPHPHGELAAESTRLCGGFELRWISSDYMVDWGNPYFRIGVIVLPDKAFVHNPGNREHTLLAPARLRIQHLVRVAGWHLIILRSSEIEGHLEKYSEEPELFSTKLRARVRRANAVYPLDASVVIRETKRRTGRSQPSGRLVERLFRHLRKQLELVFPDAEARLSSTSRMDDSASSTRRQQPSTESGASMRRDFRSA